jgi:hypothetical protein
MILMIAPLLFIAAIIFVAYPFLTDTREAEVREREMTKEEIALQRKEDLITVLKDIEMDYRMGKLSDQDYRNLKNEHEFEAVEILRSLEKIRREQANRKKNG